MRGAPLQLGALSVRLVRLWVNPAVVTNLVHKHWQSDVVSSASGTVAVSRYETHYSRWINNVKSSKNELPVLRDINAKS